MTNVKSFGFFLFNILFILILSLFLPHPLQAQATYTISGAVIDFGGRGIDGISIQFYDGETTQSEITAGGGYYSHTVSSGWTGTVTPSDPCYSFIPASPSIGPVTGDVVQDFTGNRSTNTISGIISDGPPLYAGGNLLNPISGVTLTLSTGGVAISGSDGAFSLTINCGWSGTVTPTKVGWQFTPLSRFYAEVNNDSTGQNYVGTASSTEYTISGQITDESGRTEMDGVTIEFFDGITVHTETTSAGGFYSYSVPVGWTGTVTPSLAGFTFSPASASLSLVQANTTQNFSGSLNNYTISGIIVDGSANPIPQIAVTLSTGAATVTNNSGQFDFLVPHGWSGNLVPSGSGWSFTPVYRSYINLYTDSLNEHFVGKPERNQYTISGTVTAGTTPLANVVMNGLPRNPITSTSGFYFVRVSEGWAGTVTPILSGYIFNPSSRTYTNVNDNCMNENYEALVNDLPHIEIVSPPDNTFMNGEVIIKTEASDSDGIGKVELFIDDQKVAEFFNIQNQVTEVDPYDLERIFKNNRSAFQLDGYGNKYSIVSGKDGKMALIKQKDPTKTEILLEDNMMISGWLVKPDGTVIITGTSINSGENWIRRIGSMEETLNTTDPRVDTKWNLDYSEYDTGEIDFDNTIMNPSKTVFTCKYIWDTTLYTRKPHQVKAVGYDTLGHHSEDIIELTVSNIKLHLQLERNQEKSWIITRQYVKIDTTVENPESIPIVKYVIYRKASNEEYLVVGEILAAQINDNSFTFYDKYVEKKISYSYKIEALDENDIVIGASEEKNI